MTKTNAGLSASFLEKIKKSLLEEKTRLEKEAAELAPATPNEDGGPESAFPDYGDKEDENAAEVAEYAANLSLEDTMEKALRDVNSALVTLDKGTYGICKYCHKPIDEKRLEARPTSSACVECKKAITQEL